MTLSILILIGLLGHDSHSVRERAHAVAARVVMLAPGPFVQGQYGLDGEVAVRCRSLALAWQRRFADVILREIRPADGWPWIDCHASDWPVCVDVRWSYLEWARESSGYNAPDWRASSLATEYLVRAILADGGCPKSLLARLTECEAKWRATNGYRVRSVR